MMIAVINNKGGTGKTTTCVNLAAAAIRFGQRVLVCDLDPQASASLSMGIPWRSLTPSMADVLLEDMPAGNALRRSVMPGVDLIPAHMDLVNFDGALADAPDREWRVSSCLKEAASAYDLVLCDCPPSMSLLSVNAMMAADAYLVPVTPEYLALEGLVSLMDAIERMKQGLGMNARRIGILFTLVHPSLKISREIIALVRDRFREDVFTVEIPRDARIAEAPACNQSVLDFSPGTRGARAYLAAAREMLDRLKMKAKPVSVATETGKRPSHPEKPGRTHKKNKKR